MLVLPVFLTRHSSIKVRRENDCKGKTQNLIIKKKKTILLNFNGNNQNVYQISIYPYLLARIFNPYPFRSNIYFYVICCYFVFYSVFFSTCGAIQAVFFGPMQPVPLSDFSALLPNGHICIIDCDIRIMETASGCSRLYVGT